jgi:hypothetical protein
MALLLDLLLLLIGEIVEFGGRTESAFVVHEVRAAFFSSP